jgi:hypothetical protein
MHAVFVLRKIEFFGPYGVVFPLNVVAVFTTQSAPGRQFRKVPRYSPPERASQRA